MNKIMNVLPMETQEKVRDILKAYDKVTVIFENGDYKVSTASCITSTYADDYKVLGIIHKDEIYSQDEQIVNYMESFGDFHHNYNGKKDWNMIQQIKALRKESKQALIKFDENGNLFIYDTIEIKW